MSLDWRLADLPVFVLSKKGLTQHIEVALVYQHLPCVDRSASCSAKMLPESKMS